MSDEKVILACDGCGAETNDWIMTTKSVGGPPVRWCVVCNYKHKSTLTIDQQKALQTILNGIEKKTPKLILCYLDMMKYFVEDSIKENLQNIKKA